MTLRPLIPVVIKGLVDVVVWLVLSSSGAAVASHVVGRMSDCSGWLCVGILAVLLGCWGSVRDRECGKESG